jgi:anti-sigma regulatory factor (Ser/Thr protein kinase)
VKALRAGRQLAAHEVSTVRGPLEAVRHARSRPIDVLITDPGTPLHEDLELVDELKGIRQSLKVIVLAPELSDVEVIRALRAKVFACFTEPIDEAEVVEMTRSALESADWRDDIEVVSGLPTWLTLRVACRVATADRLTRFLTEWRGDENGDRDLLMTAFREVLLNAMEHGAGFDAGKVIQVSAARTARAIVFHFKDPGGGFDATDLKHAALTSDPERVLAMALHRADAGLRPGGFGMLIARHVVDELVYNEQGNEVIMIKHTA